MRHSTPQIVVLAAALAFAGCAGPGFYQAGRNAEQCECDIRQCTSEAEQHSLSFSSGGTIASAGLRPATLTGLCMRAKGYEYMSPDRVPKDSKRTKVTTSFEDYWAIDGGATVPNLGSVLTAEHSQDVTDDASPGKLIGYQARLDENGKHTFTPVYEKEHAEETDHAELATGNK